MTPRPLFGVSEQGGYIRYWLSERRVTFCKARGITNGARVHGVITDKGVTRQAQDCQRDGDVTMTFTRRVSNLETLTRLSLFSLLKLNKSYHVCRPSHDDYGQIR